MKKNKSNEFLQGAPADYNWPRCPEADRFVETHVQRFLGQHSFARHLSEKMHKLTSTNFSAWIDHVVLPQKDVDIANLYDLGFVEDKKVKRDKGTHVYVHPHADLPRLLVSNIFKNIGCAIMVDEISAFQMRHALSLPVEGEPYSSYRRMALREKDSTLYVVERRGSQTLVPDSRKLAQVYVRNYERWLTRERYFESESAGMKDTLALAKKMVKELGAGLAAHIFLEGERVYWQSRNSAASIQKARQDRLGLGWGNHDHHTFRSSRLNFKMLIDLLLIFGFKKRERYFAGEGAGWGAQIVEQPEDGTIIFADVDLAPEDLNIDFSRIKLGDLEKPRTVGLWCALHGDSILQAGMHHLEAKFDFYQLKKDLSQEHIETMPPFSDFDFLRQAFTKAEMWHVDEARLNALRKTGRISEEAYQKIILEGAVGSHMENLERKDGFKGFNQRGVSDIITAVNPEKQALYTSTNGNGKGH